MQRLFVLTCLVFFLSACMPGVPSPNNRVTTSRDPATITQAEAEAVLQKAIDAVQKRDLQALCAMSDMPTSKDCESTFKQWGGWGGAPPDPPKIVDSYIIPNTPFGNDGIHVGGRVLVLEGVDGQGQPYRTDYFIMPIDESGPLGTYIAPIEPIYWSRMSKPRPDPNANPGGPQAVPAVRPTP